MRDFHHPEIFPSEIAFVLFAFFLVIILSSFLFYVVESFMLFKEQPDLVKATFIQPPIFFGIYFFARKRYNLSKIIGKINVGTLAFSLAGWLLIVFFWILYQKLLTYMNISLPTPQVDLAKYALKSWTNLALVGIGACFLSPLSEELFFRGFMFGILRKRYSFWLAAMITSFIFGAAHGLVLLFAMLLLSVFLCYLTEKYGTLDAPVFVHIVNNVLSVGTNLLK